MVKKPKIRYGVVGLGHIAQKAVLPAFKHAIKNSKLTAIISKDHKKLEEISKEYKIENCFYFNELEDCLRSGEIDVLYVCTPNNTHLKIVELAAKYGVHVICEKPMSVTEEDCTRMLASAERNSIKIMIAYRLHFESANLEAVKICHSGKIGELKYFNSTFSYQVKPGNIRLNKISQGGGPVYDIGIYCINAARTLFKDEPIEVMAFKTKGSDSRFKNIEESMSVMMKFPNERLANFTVSFGAFQSADFDILATKGRLYLEHAYEYSEPMTMTLYQKGKIKPVTKSVRKFGKRDQFAAELIYFSNCILHNRKPEPGPREGFLDVRIIEAIYKSASLQKPIKIEPLNKKEIQKKIQKIVKTKIHTTRMQK